MGAKNVFSPRNESYDDSSLKRRLRGRVESKNKKGKEISM